MTDEGELFKRARKLPKDWVAEAAASLLRARARGMDQLSEVRRRYDRGQAGADKPRVTLRSTDSSPWSLGDVGAELLEIALRTSDELVKLHQRHGDRVADLLMSGGMYGGGGQLDTAATTVLLKVREDQGTQEAGQASIMNDTDEELALELHVTPFEGRRQRKKGEEPEVPSRDVFVRREAVRFAVDGVPVAKGEKVALEPGEERTLEITLERDTADGGPWFKAGFRYRSELHFKIGGTSTRSIPLEIRVKRAPPRSNEGEAT